MSVTRLAVGRIPLVMSEFTERLGKVRERVLAAKEFL